MSSIPGLPMRGSDVTAVITTVHLHPLCVLVEFCAKFSQQSKADYQRLASDIQSPGAIFKELEGNPGDQCLVQIDNTWHRSRIVSRNGFSYQVFLIDKGMTCSATTKTLAWGKKEYFQVPAEVECCVLANMLPRAQEKRWFPMAQVYLQSFTGKSVAAHVQDVLVSHRIFLLHIPAISRQMYEMGFAMELSPALFLDCVLGTLKSPTGAEAPLETLQLFRGAGDEQELFMYLELSVENTVVVTVTEVISPKQVFCQLKMFSKELKRLSEKLAQSCEGSRASCILCPEMIGCPFASKGNDGQWYRSVVQQLFPTNALVEVLNVDYGTKQLVPVENIRELPTEFFRMPVFTYSCSLHGITDKDSGWEADQISFLRSFLLHKTLSAHFEYYYISEGVYSVTLYGDHNTNLNTNLNKLFGSREDCLLEGNKTVARYSIQSAASAEQHSTPETTTLLHEQVARENGDECLLSENLPQNSSHLAVVRHIISPSEFWIQTETYRKKLDELLDIYHLHKGLSNTDVKDPSVGLYCVAKAKDNKFYRASVCEVGHLKVKVFLVDYGNTEVVDRSDIRSLPPEFKEVPQLTLKCSLASVGPKDGRWNDGATEFFTRVVIDKLLIIRVKAKNEDGYVVQLTDPNAQSEQDVGRLMCNCGHAEWLEVMHPSVVMSPVDVSGNVPSCRCDNVELQTKGFVNKKASAFKARMFNIGSVLEVNVSCIESPNRFWCQLVQNMKHLQLLMDDLQSHYTNSEFQHDVENSCVAQHPSNGLWYRAFVVCRHKTPHVDVLFVDYGQTETVSIHALRRISPEFLTLDGQAFRCSLLNLMDPTTLVNNWNKEAKAKFFNFVKSAASNLLVLKCTVYAVMYNKQKAIYNVVDLKTPFESICAILAKLVSNLPPQKPNGPLASLCTYYYSGHNIKLGSEEQVTVTHVDSVNHFYCHLDKNQDVIEELSMKLNSLCNQLLNVKFSKIFAPLCFAKYPDGLWYRAQIKQSNPAVLVHFVDYGDTIEVDTSDLIPIPKEANDIVSVPVQAVLCGLADIPPDVSSEVNEWFTEAVVDCKFKALVVAKDLDGKLLVELYHGNSQVNFDIKRKFLHKAQRKQQNHGDFQAQGGRTVRTAGVFSDQATSKSSFSVCAGIVDRNCPSMNLSAQKFENGSCERTKKMRHPTLELYMPPYQRKLHNTNSNAVSGTAQAPGNPRLDSCPSETKFLLSDSPETESQQDLEGEKLPQLPELPRSRITAGMTVDVYISHCNSPLSFYVQRVDEEEELFSLVEQLNHPEWTQKDSPVQDVQAGDLVLAEFSEDSSWYRAVVKEIQEEHMALIEFIDFGNTAEAPVSNVRRLHQSFLQLPAYSTHCMLGDADGLGQRMQHPEVVSLFKEDLGVCGEKVFRCSFIKQVWPVWEVSLEDNGVAVVCKVPAEVSEEHEEEDPSNIAFTRKAEISEKCPVGICSPHKEQESTEKQLEEFIPTIKENISKKSLAGDINLEEETVQSEEKSLPTVDSHERKSFDCSPENIGEVVDEPETRTSDIEEKEVSASNSEMKTFPESNQEKTENAVKIGSFPHLMTFRTAHTFLFRDSDAEGQTVQSEEKSLSPVDAHERKSFDCSPENIGEVVDEPETRKSDIEEKEASTCNSEMKSFPEPNREKSKEVERIASIPHLTASRSVHMFLFGDSDAEGQTVHSEEKSLPPVDSHERKSFDCSPENIGEVVDEPETRTSDIEEKEASASNSEMKTFPGPGEEKHEEVDSASRSSGTASRAVQTDDESKEVCTCVEESCSADFSTDESPDGKTLGQGEENLGAGAEEVTSVVSVPCEYVGPEVKGGHDSIHDKLGNKENLSGSSVEVKEVFQQDEMASLSVEDNFTSQEKSISEDECSDRRQAAEEEDGDLFPSPGGQKQKKW